MRRSCDLDAVSDFPLLALECLNGWTLLTDMTCSPKTELQELKRQIYRLHKEYMSHGNDPNGFIHDLSVLVSDGLKDSCSVMHMAKKIGDYVLELKDVNNECM